MSFKKKHTQHKHRALSKPLEADDKQGEKKKQYENILKITTFESKNYFTKRLK